MSDREDREKLIKAMKCCAEMNCGHECPYAPIGGCRAKVLQDALALLKEQEAVVPLRPRARGRVERFWVCGECGAEIDKGDRFCRYCGRETKWED